jgi:two-component system CheB/CheR fusion protein
MVFKEVVEKLKPGRKPPLQVFATDLDKDAIDKARLGITRKILRRRGAEQMSRFFKEERGCRVRTEIREMVVFARRASSWTRPLPSWIF